MKMTEESVNFMRAQTEMIKSEPQKNEFLKRKKASGTWQSKTKGLTFIMSSESQRRKERIHEDIVAENLPYIDLQIQENERTPTN